MSRPIISADGLSKAYLIGLKRDRMATLSATVWSMLKSPVENFRRLRRLNTYAIEDDAEDVYWALKDVSFEVNQGEVVGIIGRNGAGKSTLLKLLSRITEPTRGHAVLRGRVSSLLEVGTGFHPELSGRENVYLNGTILGMTKREVDRKFDEIVEFSGVEKFLDTPIKRYSSGMQMRLAFAVAAHLEPEILIIDEVLAVGDAEFQKRCLGKMKDVAKGGRTVLFVSHQMAAVQALCTRGIELRQGRVQCVGNIASVLQSYMESGRAPSFAALDSPELLRSGHGAIVFSQLEFRDENGATIQRAKSGASLTIALKLWSKTVSTIRAYRIGIGVNDQLGGSLFVCSTETQRETGPIDLNEWVTCTINDLPLSEGTYRLTLFLEVERVIEDWLEDAVSIEVENGDFFGSGKVCPQGWHGRGILVRNKWKCGETIEALT